MARNSDQELIWLFWDEENAITNCSISYWAFMKCTSSESICRARRSIQKEFKELGPTIERVKKMRKIKEATRGTFIYREDTGQGTFA